MLYVYRFYDLYAWGGCWVCCLYKEVYLQIFKRVSPREDAGGLSREYVLRIPSVSLG